ncbi:putative lipid kinase YtlR [Lachnospiraceae bacterium]|nr:putative lipid kinase YtlR [Lachnospiraceae bacterium]
MTTFADKTSQPASLAAAASLDEYTFIVNPNSRSGLGRRMWYRVEPVLTERKVRYQVYFTKYRQHAAKIVRKLTADQKHHTIIVLGGDGTINEVLGGIRSLSLVTLGYIPTGSSNDFARSLELPTDPLLALDNLLSPSRYLSIDIGILNYDGKTRRFAVSSGMGFDAGICHEAMVSPMKTFLNLLHLGKLTYVGIALRQLLTLTPGEITVTLEDSRKLHFKKAYFATAMNLPYEGGGFRFCPNADCQDGLLDVIVISGLSRLKILTLLPTAYKGWHTRFRGVYIYSCKTVTFASSLSLPLHTDGEPILRQRQASMSLESEKLRIIAAP